MLTLLALASSAVWGTSDFVGGLLSKRWSPVAVVGWGQSISLVVLTAVLLGRYAVGAPVTWTGWPPWAVLAGLCGASALVAFYGALSTGTMGVVAPIASMGVVVPVVLGILSGDSPSAWTAIGIVVAVVGIVLASGPELSGAVSPRPVILAAGAALGFGITLFAIDRGARDSLLMTLWGMRLTSCVLFMAVALTLRSVGGIRWRTLPALAAVGCADVLANALFGAASSRGHVSIAAVLGSLYPVATILLARVVLGERLRRVQQVGVLCAVVGAAVISL